MKYKKINESKLRAIELLGKKFLFENLLPSWFWETLDVVVCLYMNELTTLTENICNKSIHYS